MHVSHFNRRIFHIVVNNNGISTYFAGFLTELFIGVVLQINVPSKEEILLYL